MSHWAAQIHQSILVASGFFVGGSPYSVDEIRVHPSILMELLRMGPDESPVRPSPDGGWTFEGIKLVEDPKEHTFRVGSAAHEAALKRQYLGARKS